MKTGITDYTVYPLVAKGGLMQLVYRADDPCFRCAVVSNTEVPEWEAENLCRPFLRLPFNGAPTATSRPGCLTLTDGNLTMEVRRSSVLHAVHVTVTSPDSVELHCGPAGTFENYGYTQHQDPSFFHGYPDEAVETGCWLTHRNEWTGALDPGSGKIKKWGVGVTIALPAGRTVLSFAAGKSKDEALASAKRVSAMSAEEAEAFLAKIWDSVMARVPEAINGLSEPVRTKAIEAVYLHLEGSRFEPTGIIRHPSPVAVMTGYRTPIANWDSSITAAALAPLDLEYAVGVILDFLENANPNGTVPNAIEACCGIGESGIGNYKHLLSWSAWHIYQTSGNPDVLDALLPGLVSQGKRLQDHVRSFPGALVRIDLIDDNTPSDDSIRRLAQPDHMGLKAEPARGLVAGGEVSGFMSNELICCARLCRAAGIEDQARSFSETARSVAEAARKHLWNAASRDIGYLYGDNYLFANNPHRFCGASLMPQKEVQSTIVSALSRGGPLWPNYGIATWGTDESAFDPNQIWRGPAWIGTNYVVAEACSAVGLVSVADDISLMTQELVARNGGFWECHNPLTGQGHRTQLTMGLNASAFLMFCFGKHRELGWVRPEELS